jgi:hypothetical protein
VRLGDHGDDHVAARSAGATWLTRPSRSGTGGARTATTPTGSGIEKEKKGWATGLTEPRTAWSLSVQPA